MLEFLGLIWPIIVGYFVALVVYLACTFAFARLAGSQLASEGRPLPGFWFATGLSWLFATVAATYFVVTRVPYPIEMFLLSAVLIAIVLRSASTFSSQQPRSIAVTAILCISAGSGIVWFLVH